jgi:hypothetical protein
MFETYETQKYTVWAECGLLSCKSKQVVQREPGTAMGHELLHRVQTEPGAHTASYPMGTGGSMDGGKATHSSELFTL